jgi:ribosomal protein L32
MKCPSCGAYKLHGRICDNCGAKMIRPEETKREREINRAPWSKFTNHPQKGQVKE